MGTSGPRALGLGCDLLQPARVARGQDRQFVAVEIFVQPEVEGARPLRARDLLAGLHEVLQERDAVERRVVVWQAVVRRRRGRARCGRSAASLVTRGWWEGKP